MESRGSQNNECETRPQIGDPHRSNAKPSDQCSRNRPKSSKPGWIVHVQALHNTPSMSKVEYPTDDRNAQEERSSGEHVHLPPRRSKRKAPHLLDLREFCAKLQSPPLLHALQPGNELVESGIVDPGPVLLAARRLDMVGFRVRLAEQFVDNVPHVVALLVRGVVLLTDVQNHDVKSTRREAVGPSGVGESIAITQVRAANDGLERAGQAVSFDRANGGTEVARIELELVDGFLKARLFAGELVDLNLHHRRDQNLIWLPARHMGTVPEQLVLRPERRWDRQRHEVPALHRFQARAQHLRNPPLHGAVLLRESMDCGSDDTASLAQLAQSFHFDQQDGKILRIDEHSLTDLDSANSPKGNPPVERGAADAQETSSFDFRDTGTDRDAKLNDCLLEGGSQLIARCILLHEGGTGVSVARDLWCRLSHDLIVAAYLRLRPCFVNIRIYVAPVARR